jgi:rhodanese-related sulfurtransferase
MERLGRPDAPLVLDVRTEEDAAKDTRRLPLSRRAGHLDAAGLAPGLQGREVAVVCERGRKLSEGAAAWLRVQGVNARALEGGFRGWAEAGLPLLNPGALPSRDASGRSVWVTRARPKVDRIACPWLIRRFVDPEAVFLFVAPDEVAAVAERFGAIPFDVEGVFWSHRGPLCSFDVMIAEFGLSLPALDHLARIVRGADTAAMELAPECAGLLAASLGLSRMFEDDLAQLDAGLALYDAFWRWCREAAGETHNWPAARMPA